MIFFFSVLFWITIIFPFFTQLYAWLIFQPLPIKLYLIFQPPTNSNPFYSAPKSMTES